MRAAATQGFTEDKATASAAAVAAVEVELVAAQQKLQVRQTEPPSDCHRNPFPSAQPCPSLRSLDAVQRILWISVPRAGPSPSHRRRRRPGGASFSGRSSAPRPSSRRARSGRWCCPTPTLHAPLQQQGLWGWAAGAPCFDRYIADLIFFSIARSGTTPSRLCTTGDVPTQQPATRKTSEKRGGISPPPSGP